MFAVHFISSLKYSQNLRLNQKLLQYKWPKKCSKKFNLIRSIWIVLKIFRTIQKSIRICIKLYKWCFYYKNSSVLKDDFYENDVCSLKYLVLFIYFDTISLLRSFFELNLVLFRIIFNNNFYQKYFHEIYRNLNVSKLEPNITTYVVHMNYNLIIEYDQLLNFFTHSIFNHYNLE